MLVCCKTYKAFEFACYNYDVLGLMIKMICCFCIESEYRDKRFIKFVDQKYTLYMYMYKKKKKKFFPEFHWFLGHLCHPRSNSC